MKSFSTFLYQNVPFTLDAMRNPSLTLFGRTFSFLDVCKKINNLLPMQWMKKNVKDDGDNSTITSHDVKKVFNTLNSISLSTTDQNEIRILEKNITFGSDAYMGTREPQNSKKYIVKTIVSASSIKITIDTNAYPFQAALKENYGFCIDTGVVVQHAPGSKFVLIPQSITCDDPDMIPTIWVRDESCRGPIFISGMTKSGNLGVVHVILRAYGVKKIDSEVKFDPPMKKPFIKPKDYKFNRYVINSKINIDFEQMTENEDEKCLEVKVMKKKQISGAMLIKLDPNHTMVFSSRNREWCNPGLVSLTGLYSSKFGLIAPMLKKENDADARVFCMSIITSKIPMKIRFETQNLNFPQIYPFNDDIYFTMHGINGAFFHHLGDHYKTITRHMDTLIDSLLYISNRYRFFFLRNKSEADYCNFIRVSGYTNNCQNFFSQNMHTSSVDLDADPTVESDRNFKNVALSLLELILILFEDQFSVAEKAAINKQLILISRKQPFNLYDLEKKIAIKKRSHEDETNEKTIDSTKTDTAIAADAAIEENQEQEPEEKKIKT